MAEVLRVATMARFIRSGRRKVEGGILLSLGLLAACGSVRAEDTDILLSAPRLPPYQWFASTDPKHQNADYIALKPGETKRVPLAAGNLLRLWSTALEPEKITMVLQNGGQATELLSGGKAKLGDIYQKAFTFYPTSDTPAVARVLKSDAVLIATNHSKVENKWFYQAAVRPTLKVSTEALKSVPSSSLPGKLHHQDVKDAANELWRNWFEDSKTVAIPAHQNVAFWSTKGAGCISEIEITVTDSDVQSLQDAKLQLNTDGKEIVALPLDQIPANGKDHTLEFLVPFSNGARLEIVNGSGKPIQLKTRVISHPLTSDYRLCASAGSARSQKGKPIPILKVQGEGAFVGLVLDIRPAPDATRRTFAFLEGNENLIADGKKYEGTGAEDFFNSAWYFPEKPFSQTYHGLTLKTTSPPRVTAYRWMVPDAVPFSKSFQFDFEHGNGNNSNDLEYRWVAFWYQKAPFNFKIVDELKSASGNQVGAGSASEDPSQNLLIFIVPALGLVAGTLGVLAIKRKRTQL